MSPGMRATYIPLHRITKLCIQIHHARAPARHPVRREAGAHQSLSGNMGERSDTVFRGRPESLPGHLEWRD